MHLNDIVLKEYLPQHKLELVALLQLNVPTYFAVSEIADFEAYLDNEIEQYYVVFFEGKIIGCGGINFEDERAIGIISWDIIHPDYQGKSVGRLLLQHRISVLNSIKSIDKIIVRTSQLTSVFYQKQGFEVKEIVKDYWAKGFDLYFMEYISSI